jgi:Mannosyltransferase (PIG-V)
MRRVRRRLRDGIRDSREPLLVFAVTRGALFLLAYLSLAVLPLNQEPGLATPGQAPWRGFPNNLWLDGWARWDAGWYRHIATHGYVDQVVGPTGQRNLAFYPLYPLTMRVVSLVGLDPLAAGILVSNLAFLAALVLLHRLVRARFGADVAFRCVLLLSVFPFSFYFSAVYSESLFVLLAVASLYLAHQERWAAAAFCALLCGATRAPGLALAPALGLLYLERIQFDLRRVRLDALWLGLSVLGPVLFYAYLHLAFGDPWLAFKATRVPGWWQGGVNLKPAERAVRALRSLETLRTGQFPVVFDLNLLAAAVSAGSLVAVFRRQPLAWGVFGLLIVASGVLQPGGWGRYVLPAFPVFLAWALGLERRWAFTGVVVTSTLLLALLTILYTHWYWVA